VTDRTGAATIDAEQERKKSELLHALSKLVDDVRANRLYGKFTVGFNAHGGLINQCEENRDRTWK
jgi:hypothetical protein